MLPLRLTWALLIKQASKFPFFSERRKARHRRSAVKRLHNISHCLGGGVKESASYEKIDFPTQVRAVDRSNPTEITPKYRILLICLHAPTVNHAGGLRILDIIKMIKFNIPNSYVEVFTSANMSLYGPVDTAIHLADHVVVADNYNFSLDEYLSKSNVKHSAFDVIDFQFPQPIDVIKSYRKIGKRLTFTPMESNVRNELIKRTLTPHKEIKLRSKTALQEVEIINAVDQTMCVSEMDSAAIKPFVTGKLIAIETGISEIEFSNDIVAADDVNPLRVCYVAYFGSQTNRDALSWYLQKVHPLIVAEVPDYELSIVGRGDINDLLMPMPPCVKYVGEVDRIAPYIMSASVGIAPALSGSGFRGKINQYAFLGLPTVASPLSAEGLAYVDEKSILVAEKPKKFAESIVRLIKNKSFREEMAAEAFEVAQANYTWDSKWPAVAKAYGLPVHVDQFSNPTVHAVVPSYQHAPFIEERIRSIFDQEYPHIRVTVIDDCSTDGSDEVIQRLKNEFDFEYIRRSENSGTPFSAWEYAANNTTEDLIWICESDDAAHPMLVATLTKLLHTRKSAQVAYCESWIMDETGMVQGSTLDYHVEQFHNRNWDQAFCSFGERELKEFLRFGMVVPNMSSALIARDAFKKAFTQNIKKYRLAGDWLFIGQAMLSGDIVFTPQLLNRFRSHQQTSRKITNEVREMAEHVSVRLILSNLVEANEAERMDAVKHDISKLRRKPNLVAPVLEELKQIHRPSEVAFRALLDLHIKNKKISASLDEALSTSAL